MLIERTPCYTAVMRFVQAAALSALVGVSSVGIAQPRMTAEPAEPFASSTRLALRRATTLEVEEVRPVGETAHTVVRLRAGTRVERTLPGVPLAVRSEVLQVGRHKIAKIEIDAGDRRHVLLVHTPRSTPEILFEGRADWTGDRGERRRDVVSFEDRTGDGTPDLVVGFVDESRVVCGSTDALIDPRAFDPQSGALRSVSLRTLVTSGSEPMLQATLTPPEGTNLDEPLVRALAARSASSSLGTPPALTPPPLPLVDHDPMTAWVEGQGGPGTWAFVTTEWTAPDLPIRALAFRTADRADVTPPKAFWIAYDEGRLRVQLAEVPAPGTRVFIPVPEPLRTRCLSLVVEETFGPHTGFASFDVYTDIEFGGGLDTLIARLAGGGERAATAARLLSGVGAPVVAPLLARWPDMPAGERLLATSIFAAALPHQDAQEALLQAAVDPDAGVRAAALAGAESSVPVLAALVPVPGGPGDEGALRLARLDGAEAVAPILATMAADPERPELRRALRTAFERGGDLNALADWQAPVHARASATLALAGSDEAPLRNQAALLAAATAPHVVEFVDRWRLALAAARLPADVPTNRWLTSQASADEWMMRSVAVAALGVRGGDGARATARRATSDDTPRVRVAAIEALARLGLEGNEVERVATLARRDTWPLVREAGVRGLEASVRAHPVVHAAITDPARGVRAAAIQTATEAQDPEAWPRIDARMRDDGEWPEVVTAGVHYIRAMCRADAVETLEVVVARALKPDAWAPDLDVAGEAMLALLSLGTEEALAVVAHASRHGAPPALRMAAEGRVRVAPCTRE